MTTTSELTMTPVQAEAVRDAGIFALGTSRWITNETIAKLTGEQWIFQASPGVNHILWNVGHIAVSESHFVSSTGGKSTAAPESYQELFAGGKSEPKPSLDDYPDPQEVVGVLNKVREELVAHFNGLSGEQLAVGTEGDMMKQLCPTIAQVPNFCVLHEATHVGQILIARRGLGLSRVMG